MVSARDELLSGGGTKFGSFWACEIGAEMLAMSGGGDMSGVMSGHDSIARR